MTREQEIQARVEAATQKAREIVATLLSELSHLTAANTDQAARIAELEREYKITHRALRREKVVAQRQLTKSKDLEAERDAAKQDIKVAAMLSGKCKLFCANVPVLCNTCSDMCHWKWCCIQREGEQG